MTRTNARLRDKRPHVASHFRVADVQMKALNDPLPPHHPGSPETQRKNDNFHYYGLDLPELQRKRPHRANNSSEPQRTANVFNPSSTWAEKSEDLYPSVSHETRRLLREVASIRMQYRQKSAGQISSEEPTWSKDESTPKEDAAKAKRPRKVSNFSLANLDTSIDEDGRILPKNVDQDEKTSSGKPDVNVLQENSNSARKSQREKAHKNRIVTHVTSFKFGISATQNSEQLKPAAKVNDVEKSDELQAQNTLKLESNQLASESNANKGVEKLNDTCTTPQKNPDTKAWRTNMKRSPSKEKNTSLEEIQKPELDKTFEMKAWRINMKPSPSKEKSNDSIVRNDTALGSVVESGNDKPWRHNMKKSLSAEDDMGPTVDTAEGMSCHARQRPHDHDRVKKFMKVKRHKAMADRKVKDQEAKKKKAQVQERLLALEAFRKSQGQGKGSKASETDNELILRLRKQEEEEKLKKLLIQLTDEMRMKHKKDVTSSSRSPQNNEISLNSNNKTEFSKSSLATRHELEASKSKSNHKVDNSSLVHKSITEANSVGSSKRESMREQIERLRLRENNIAEAIKSCDPELIAAPDNDVVDQGSERGVLQKPPDIVMPCYFYPKTSSTPAASAMRNQVDAFNFMSSARRKFEAEEEAAALKNQLATPSPSPLLALSEGPISSESISSKSSLVGKKTSTEVVTKSESFPPPNDHQLMMEEEVPVRDETSATRNDHGEKNVVPTALHLRFQAELNQLESIQEAERQINQISHIREVVGAKNDAATMAAFAQTLAARGSSSKKSNGKTEASRSSSKETRSQFEARMRNELHELFNSRMAELMKNQMQATKMTYETAQMLANVKSKPTKLTEANTKRSASGGSSSIPEDIKTLMSQAESEIPEILSVVEATDKSSKDIQRSIQNAIRELSLGGGDDNSSRMSNITEEIAAELSESGPSLDQISNEDEEKTSMDSTSSTWCTGHVFMQHLEDQRVRDRQQFAMITKREQILSEKVGAAMEKLEQEREKAAQLGDNHRLKRLAAKEKKVRKYHRDHREELANLRYTLQVAEKERKLLQHQHRKLASLKAKAVTFTTDEDNDDDYDKTIASVSSSIASSSQVLDDERTLRHNDEDVGSEKMSGSTAAFKKTKMDIFKKKMGAASLKAPLSPKKMEMRKQLRKRHSSAESDDSNSILSVSSIGGDQSDLEIRVHVLKEELSRRIKTAAKLKREQKLARRERLKVQEDTLKKQIEVYDNLIIQTKAEMVEAISPQPTTSQANIVPPQIKVPRQQTMNIEHSSPTLSTCSLSEAAASNSISVEDSTDTIIVSPQKPATPSGGVEEEAPPVWPEVKPESPLVIGVEAANAGYSDDFTSSSCMSSLGEQQKIDASKKPPPSEKTIDSICGYLLESMIDDAFGRVKLRRPKEPQSMLQAEESKQPPRPRPVQDMMVSTFDLTSESSDEDGPTGNEEEENVAGKEVASSSNEEEKLVDVATAEENEAGDFIDDDFGLSIRREYEILRQQQLRIEEEINNIQKEKIPDKPPPPYTPPVPPPAATPPPASPLSPKKPPSTAKLDSPRYVPSTKEALTSIVEVLVKNLIKARASGEVAVLDKNLESQCLDNLVSTSNETHHEKSKRLFVKFVFDLVTELDHDLHKVEHEEQNPPWMWQKPLALGLATLPKTEDELFAAINREVLVAFNYEKRAQKENMIIRWSQKRRDRVDQVLVRELHAEEASWTNYEDDEVKVKDDLADFILDALITDTTRAFSRILCVS